MCIDWNISFYFFVKYLILSLLVCILLSLPVMAFSPGHIPYCRNHYSNSLCDRGCDSAACGWDGGDCFAQQSSLWAKGTLVLHTNIPLKGGTFTNSSVLWALAVLLQTPLKLRDSVPLATSRKLFDFDPQQLANLLAQAPPADSDGWVHTCY